jgi:hypothetical protein
MRLMLPLHWLFCVARIRSTRERKERMGISHTYIAWHQHKKCDTHRACQFENVTLLLDEKGIRGNALELKMWENYDTQKRKRKIVYTFAQITIFNNYI